MISIFYKCRLLTDVIISATAATEGFHRSLNYIPGAKFLGIAAQNLYKMEEGDQTLDLFHNGSVRFGDALPLIDGEVAYPVPLNWYVKKGKKPEEGVYLHSELLDATKRKELLKEEVQTKRAPSGYITRDRKHLQVDQNFSIKSAYDSKQYRSKEGQMYGYFALKKGTDWAFQIDFDSLDHVQLVRNTMNGKFRIGRSSSAEYGLVEISEISGTYKPFLEEKEGVNYLYAMSKLCFYDNNGRVSLQPNEEHLGFEKGEIEICWRKSQIKHRLYRTWNQTRQNRDADRMIIERGSIIAFKRSDTTKEKINNQFFEGGIGSHRSEGLGQVILNPEFLKFNNENERKVKAINSSWGESSFNYYAQEEQTDKDILVIKYLNRIEAENTKESDIDAKVNTFIKAYLTKFEEISNSQWGQVRNIAKNSHSNLSILKKVLFDKDVGFFHTGQTEKDWRKKGRRTILQKHLFPYDFDKDDRTSLEFMLLQEEVSEFLIKLCNEFAKAKKNKV